MMRSHGEEESLTECGTIVSSHVDSVSVWSPSTQRPPLVSGQLLLSLGERPTYSWDSRPAQWVILGEQLLGIR